MGWKGTLRSIQAASRAAERDAQRRQRARDKEYRELQKEQEKADAADAVAAYEELIDRLTSVHRRTTARAVDWTRVASASVQSAPRRNSKHEDEAFDALTSYKPSLVDKAFGRASKIIHDLELAVPAARERDEEEYAKAVRVHRRNAKLVEARAKEAQRIIAGDLEEMARVLEKQDRLREISDLGSSFSVSLSRPDEGEDLPGGLLARVTVAVHSKEIVPDEKYGLLQSGKLSVKKMPVGEFHEIHQDYVCGCLLRVAAELFNILPLDGVISTCTDEMLDTATGHIGEVAIASAYIPRTSLDRINLAAVDPSDAMGNFLHRMDFRRTKGFKPVEAMTREDIPSSVG